MNNPLFFYFSLLATRRTVHIHYIQRLFFLSFKRVNLLLSSFLFISLSLSLWCSLIFFLFDYLSRWITRVCVFKDRWYRYCLVRKFIAAWNRRRSSSSATFVRTFRVGYYCAERVESPCRHHPWPPHSLVLFIFGWVNTVTDRFLDWKNSAREDTSPWGRTSITE